MTQPVHALPTRVLLTLSVEDLVAACRAATSWNATEAERVDAVLRTRVLDAVRAGYDPEELETLRATLARLVKPSMREALDAMEVRWSSRWRAYADVVATRLGQLGQLDVERLRRRRHVADIEEVLARDPGVTQQDLADRLGLSKANLSRLLTAMEDHGLVERRTEGRVNRVFVKQATQQPPVVHALAVAQNRENARPMHDIYRVAQ